MATLPASVRELVFDVDGCLAIGNTPVPGALQTLAALRDRGYRFILFTNDSLLSPAAWARKVADLGFRWPDLRVLTAGEVAADWLARRFPGGRVLVVGSEAMAEEIRRRGLQVLQLREATEAQAVLVARTPEFTYAQLTAALRALRAGAILVTTSMARTIPTPDGPVPGTGALTSALAYAANTEPLLLGKPSALASQVCLSLAGFAPDRCAFVGDDPALDVAAGRAVGAFSVLVLTGTATQEDVPSLPEAQRPDLVLPSVRDLLEALP
ncbi:MAG: HAD-IIA family hydrolase [Armatimonadota bacterium]|nr:HAD-IIA family hydrolase [Armatimonadota bacterium]MDR7389344.1 HAD-IIA family hydrolase [Armatimonadota bacterium]MDR7393964.1 HAD-IIA family hydrolase [Armatimonadota bacterium]MDR7399701.1 HAD-IIA family hydrolase [Armatimonadota bacterium]MDR7406595.1 HAD-IIA family hydrolase [Armatimonadota bacterium]